MDDDARQLAVRLQPGIRRRGQGVEVLGPQRFADFDDEHPDSGSRRWDTPGPSGSELSQAMASSRSSLPKMRSGKGSRNPMRWIIRGSTGVGHDRVAVDQPQQRRGPECVLGLLPGRAGGEALVLRADLDEEPDPPTLPAGLVEDRFDRLLVVFPGQRADSGEGDDPRGRPRSCLACSGLLSDSAGSRSRPR